MSTLATMAASVRGDQPGGGLPRPARQRCRCRALGICTAPAVEVEHRGCWSPSMWSVLGVGGRIQGERIWEEGEEEEDKDGKMGG